jgi:hypothetical protein
MRDKQGKKKKILQWKPLNVITLGPRETGHINRLITLTDDHFSAKNDTISISIFLPNLV